jgi:hypothetical protein
MGVLGAVDTENKEVVGRGLSGMVNRESPHYYTYHLIYNMLSSS